MEVSPISEPVQSRLLLVDGHAYAYRAFHAIRELKGPDGAPTNAIFGFIKMLEKMRTTLVPSHLAVVWDGGLAAERMAEHPEYKAQRPAMPAGLEQQVEEIVHYLSAARIVSLCQDGIEADDWIAAIARRSTAAGQRVIIASSDKDFMQLVGEHVGLLNPNDKSERIWSGEDVRARTGVGPEQIVDWLSLVGDSVDNIPGVPGVGPKTATDLLRQFGSVDAIYARLTEVKSERVRAALASTESAVRRNQRLIRLNETLPGEFEIESARLGEPDYETLAALFARWGFKTMLAQVTDRRPQQEQLL
jgi:DNA polymerase-1